jgi:hypothetical protein
MPSVLRWVIVAALVAGCSRRKPGSEPPTTSTLDVDGSPADASLVVGVEERAISDQAVFSAPIAAARVGRVDFVAGLVAADGVVRAMAFADGRALWSVEALQNAKWAPDAALRAFPAGDGVALVWWGLRDGKPSRTLLQLGLKGEAHGAPAEIGAAFCGTVEGAVWFAPHAGGVTRVRARLWAETDARDVMTVPKDRDASLVCGDHAVIVLADGGEDVTACSFAPGDAIAPRARVVSHDADFADEEREHEAYSLGDDLGLLRVGASGAIALRVITAAGAAGPWSRTKATLPEDDDVVAVDGDARAVFVVATHPGDAECPGAGSMAQAVRGIRFDRTTGEDSLLDLAPIDCDVSLGPFWIGQAPAGTVVAWVERQSRSLGKSAPIRGVAYRVVSGNRVRTGRIGQPADAIVDAGCDRTGCSVAALVREPGTDGMQPERIRVFGYR